MASPFEQTDIPALERDATKHSLDNGHSLLSPSGASSWGQCAGVGLGLHESRKTSPDSIASIEGTLGHYILEVCCTKKIHPSQLNASHNKSILSEASLWVSRIIDHPTNTVEVKKYALQCYERIQSMSLEPEMVIEIAKVYENVMAYVSDGWTLYCELKVSLKEFMGHSQCDGTSDIVLVKGTTLIVADLKYGKSLPVHPQQNKQLMLYALGAIVKIMRELKILIDVVVIVIMQSRIDNNVWEAWETTYTEIYNLIVPTIRDASIRTLEVIAYPEKVTKDTFNPSESACEWCHRRKGCIARSDYAKELALNAFKTLDPNQSDSLKPDNSFLQIIDSKTLAQILRDAPFVIAWLKSAESEAHDRCRKGDTEVGLKLVQGRNSYKFPFKTEAEKVRQLLKAGVPVDKAVNLKAITPAGLKAVSLDKDVRERVQALVLNTKGNPVVALESDPREAFDRHAVARAAFGSSTLNQ